MFTSEVAVSGATISACNGMYHEKPTQRFYENNHGGVIYYCNGQWRLTTRTMSSDGHLVEGLGYAADAFYFVDSEEYEPPIGLWKSVDGTGQCKLEARLTVAFRKFSRRSSPRYSLLVRHEFSNHVCYRMFACQVKQEKGAETLNNDAGHKGAGAVEHPDHYTMSRRFSRLGGQHIRRICCLTVAPFVLHTFANIT